MPRFTVREFGQCLKFGGGGDTVSIPNIQTSIPGAFTLSAWVKRTGGMTVSGGQNIFRASGGDHLWFNFQSDSTLRIYLSEGSINATVSTTPAKKDLAWHFYVATWDGVTVKLYEDNVLIGSQAVTGTINWSGINLQVGAGASTNCIQGMIDEPSVFSRALTPTELTNLYYGGIIPGNGLLVRFLFDEGSGTSATDASGNGNTGTIVGPTYSTDVFMKARTVVT